MMKIAPISEKPTAIKVVTPNLLIIGKLARQSAENPKNVACPTLPAGFAPGVVPVPDWIG
jgi:hypothetical protein